MIKNLPAEQEMWVRFLCREDPLEEGMATHSSILAWEIPWTEEPGRLQSMGSQKDTTERLTLSLFQSVKATWWTIPPYTLSPVFGSFAQLCCPPYLRDSDLANQSLGDSTWPKTGQRESGQELLGETVAKRLGRSAAITQAKNFIHSVTIERKLPEDEASAE